MANNPKSDENEKSPLFDYARKMLLAGIGAVALAQDEIEGFIEKMLERGEIAEKEARSLLDEVKSRRKEQVRKTEDVLEKQLEKLLARMNVPMKADIDVLQQRILELTEKVEQLSNKE